MLETKCSVYMPQIKTIEIIQFVWPIEISEKKMYFDSRTNYTDSCQSWALCYKMKSQFPVDLYSYFPLANYFFIFPLLTTFFCLISDSHPLFQPFSWLMLTLLAYLEIASNRQHCFCSCILLLCTKEGVESSRMKLIWNSFYCTFDSLCFFFKHLHYKWVLFCFVSACISDW